MKHKLTCASWVAWVAWAAWALTTLLISGGANALALQVEPSPLTIYGIDFAHIDRLPVCMEIDANTDLNRYEGENALVLQPSPTACTTHLCRHAESANGRP